MKVRQQGAKGVSIAAGNSSGSDSEVAEPEVGTLPTEAHLLASALARAGFPAAVAIASSSEIALPRGFDSPPPFAIHLTTHVPIDELLHALQRLGTARANRAVLLFAYQKHTYREVLDVDSENAVVAVRRRFARHASRRPDLIGVVWRPNAANESPEHLPAKPWRTLRMLRQSANPEPIRHIVNLPGEMPLAPNAYFVGPPADPRPAFDAGKRFFDIWFSIFALTITLPVTIPVAILVKLLDRGPIFFSHQREGRHGKPFGCLKFRTMIRNAHVLQKLMRDENQVDGPQFKIKHDPRITVLGRFLRKTNIDELPQFWNVLLGDMSVVGPRPSPFEENQLCPAWREARLSVKPGITGLWQVSRSRSRGASDFQEWIYFDSQYVERRSFWLDFRIVLLTLKELFGNGQ